MLLSKNKFIGIISLLLIAILLPENTFAKDKIQKKELRILSYNIQFLPNFLRHIQHFPRKRAPFIGKAVLGDSVDVVVFQEMFDAPARKALIKELEGTFPYIVGPRKNKPKGWKRGTGVMIMSKYPITPLEKIKFSKCKGIDCLANKGVVAVQLNFDGQPIQIYGTHLQAEASEELLRLQHHEFGQLLKKYEKKNIPQISLGDFNTTKADTALYHNLLTELQSEDGNLTGEIQNTFDSNVNDMQKPTGERGVIDYILYKGNGIKLKSAKRQVRAYQHKWGKKNKDLSDHYALLADFKF
ncbi:MAG: sphingomyelin phosphodiesterase [Chitinophagales bacterium]|nr:sphingomyelin phosphodiesterase [Chitinophagales bacterium]HRP38182.1 sphingomyelin phosphodiesterase [Chitinophagales bacterium]